MPRKKTTTSEKSSLGFLDYFRFGDSYTSLILGMVIVILAIILLTALLRNKNFSELITGRPKQDTSSTKTEPTEGQIGGVYTVQSGDNLWSIAEATYKSGYNWVDIAQANNLTNPDALEAGMKVKLPEVDAKETTIAQEANSQSTVASEETAKITGNTYTVQEGDYLWDIAERAYGDGYRWVQIARDNNVANPDIIYSGTVLTLSRS